MADLRSHPRVMMPRYFKRPWTENRGDQFATWGHANYFFEVDTNGYATRQIEDYYEGPTLRYGPDLREDRHGGLSTGVVINDEAVWGPYQISQEQFEQKWATDPSEYSLMRTTAHVQIFEHGTSKAGLHGTDNRSIVFRFTDGVAEFNLMATASTKDGSIFKRGEEQQDVSVDFLVSEAAKHVIAEQADFTLWMGKAIGNGTIMSIDSRPREQRYADPSSAFAEDWTWDEIDEEVAADSERLYLVPILIGLHASDLARAAALCIDLATHIDPIVRGNALLGLGHLVRRGADTDLDALAIVLDKGLEDENSHVRGQAHSAHDDIEQFTGLSLFESPAGEVWFAPKPPST